MTDKVENDASGSQTHGRPAHRFNSWADYSLCISAPRSFEPLYDIHTGGQGGLEYFS